jgi:hypothetical protein
MQTGSLVDPYPTSAPASIINYEVNLHWRPTIINLFIKPDDQSGRCANEGRTAAGLDDRGPIASKEKDISLFSTASKQVLEPTRPSIQWVPGALSQGIKTVGA